MQDTGIGIPLERQAAVFDRFTQVDGSTTRKYGGTGLGLTISRQLVEAMGGNIGVDSSPGVGSTFWFNLKYQKQPREKQGTAPLTLGPVNLTQARVLVVDDNQTNRMVLTKNVEALGSRVEAVSSGAKALETLRNAHRLGDPYHVVLLDMQMPGMDGEQTTRAIKSDPAVKEVKILILTSMGHRGDAVGWRRWVARVTCSNRSSSRCSLMLSSQCLAVKTTEPSIDYTSPLTEQRKVGLRILLAEDNPINQKLALVLLQKAGYSVDAVGTGREAVEQIQANPYSAVLMDVQMPEMDGFEATHEIRTWESHTGRHIPIIAMTAHAMKGDRERCLAAGMDDYVTKPLAPKALISVLDRWIRIPEPSSETIQLTEDYASPDTAFDMDLDDGLFGESPAPPAQKKQQPVQVNQSLASPDSLPVDFDTAMERFDNDREFLMQMFSQYKDQLPERLKEIRFAMQDQDANRLALLAHNLKGVSLNFSANPLAEITRQLEESCRREDSLQRAVSADTVGSRSAASAELLNQE